MKYILSNPNLADRSQVEITKDQYSAVLEARNCLVHTRDLEEKFAYMVDNYFELENDALYHTLYHSMHPSRPSAEGVSDIHLFNRRIINLLTTTRLFFDHTKRHLGAMNIGNLKDDFIAATNRAYDGNFAYRLLEALRNHVQHRGLPLMGITRIDELNRSNPKNSFSELTVRFQLDIKGLLEDPDFKTTVANELQTFGVDSIDLRPLIRKYVELIAVCNSVIRDQVCDSIEIWRKTISDTIELFSTSDKTMARGVKVRIIDSAEFSDGFLIHTVVAERIDRLRDLYSQLEFVSQRFVTANPLGE